MEGALKHAAVALAALIAASAAAEPYDLVIANGRVMDPESGLDAVRHVAIAGGVIRALAEAPPAARETLDASGLVVAPGFVDLHAHGQDPHSNAFQARDGVTTALDLEAGAWPVDAFYASREGQARLHYGVSVGHIPARVKLKHGFDSVHPLTTPYVATGFRAWVVRLVLRYWRPMGYAHDPADAEEIARLRELLAGGLDEGALGIGIALDYVPGASSQEVRAIFELAAERSVACFVHMRGVARPDDMSAFEDTVGHALATGASLHLVHITSSGQRRTPAYLARIRRLRAEGRDVSVEAYPYTAGSTLLESAFFDEGWRERVGIDYGDLQWSATGERLTAETFERYRREGGPVIIHMMTPEIVDPAIADPMVMIASDGIPMLKGGEHPRGAGAFSRVLGRYARERGVLSLMDALGKMTLMPAQRLESFAPAMRRKGRVAVGADADLTLLDPERVIDRATFENSYQYSDGIEHVLVAGTFVVRDGELVEDAFPGRPIRAESAAR